MRCSAPLTISCPNGPRTPGEILTDAEIVTISVAQQLLGINSDEQFWAIAPRRLGHLFPRLPQRPGFVKRGQRLSDTIEALVAEFARHSPGSADDLLVVDSTPIECARSIETTRRSALADAADYRYCASHSRFFSGFRLHGLFALDGTPRALVLTSPKTPEREVCLDMLARLDRRGAITVVGDKGYAGREFEAQAAQLGALVVPRAAKTSPAADRTWPRSANASRLSGRRLPSDCLARLRCMGARFIGGDREQVFLMPPSVRDWVPEGHLVWTVLDAVGELDLAAIYADYRADGHGGPAYEPSMMVALLLYAYACGTRSSRGIERACIEDVAYRVVAGNVAPDHSTIAEFRVRHERPLADLFSGVLGLCARAGLASVGVVAIDGTKIAANASMGANRDFVRSRGRSSPRPRRSTGARTSSTAVSAVTSCLSICARARRAARRCVRPRSAWRANASTRPSRQLTMRRR